ncbi:gamma-interferon-inducible lysosomal thiol reductase [Drosophila grimshawi]|uniref:gamma-interferon-inducible lysosomal thiol reductase n=1 Tax=Drosophila grimshawi TaxID=7222 RepID=UPI000C86FC01|nr:gamma-interferon-inducible lysosomal thiol reductase [Drosophila grimshawi]
MIPTRKRIFLVILLIALLGLLLRFLLFNRPLPDLKDEANYRRSTGEPVLVMVFYEALCPDSKYFITKQLLPAYKNAAPIMEVQLVPYGKAHTKTDAEGKLIFDCQHGATECQANIYHACVAEIIDDPLIRLEVVNCMIRDNRLPKDAMHKCAKQHNFENIDLIQKCFDSNHGSELMKLNGDATSALRPQVTFIPTITLDGSQGRQASILKDLLGEICKVAAGMDQAEKICKH